MQLRPVRSLAWLVVVLTAACGNDPVPQPLDAAGSESGMSEGGGAGGVGGNGGDGGVGGTGGMDAAQLIDAGGIDAAQTTDAAGGGDASDLDAGALSDASADGASGTGGVSGTGGTGGTTPCVATGACDPFDPAACPNQACRWSSSGTACVNLQLPTVGIGEACGPNNCEPGSMCLGAGGIYTCRQLCPRGSVGECASGSACTGTIGDVCVGFCIAYPEPCDALLQDCVDANDTCTFATHPETNARYTGCRPAGTQLQGEACGSSAGSCGHGLVCINGGNGATCRAICDPNGGTPMCGGSLSCTGLSSSYMVPFCQ